MVGLTHADQTGGGNQAGRVDGIRLRGGLAVQCGHRKNPVCVQDLHQHTPVARFEDVEGKQGMGEEDGPRQGHDGDLFGKADIHIGALWFEQHHTP